MTFFIVNIAENLQTKRAQRNRSVYQALKKQGVPVKIISSDFDHGTRKRISTRHEDEILIRVLSYNNNFSLSRVFNHIYFSLFVFFLILFRKDVNAILISSIPSELLFAASLLKRIRKKIRIVVDVRDIWPDSLPSQSNKFLLFKLFRFYAHVLNKFSFKILDQIIYTNPDFSEFLARYGVEGSFVPLGYDQRRFKTEAHANSNLRSGLVYIGNLNASF